MEKKINILAEIKSLLKYLPENVEERIELINKIRKAIHDECPMKKEPVDFIRWVKSDCVIANDYNPNTVAPPEMKLLEHSIKQDGYTQPIVAWKRDTSYEVVDGFHRNRIGKESKEVNEKIFSFLPIAVINDERIEKGDRISSTIRHNRARGKHTVEGMSEIVLELKRRNWSDKKISEELGMDQDEVLRLCQITGLAEMFKDKEFSLAWEADILEDDDFLKDKDGND